MNAQAGNRTEKNKIDCSRCKAQLALTVSQLPQHWLERARGSKRKQQEVSERGLQRLTVQGFLEFLTRI